MLEDLRRSLRQLEHGPRQVVMSRNLLCINLNSLYLYRLIDKQEEDEEGKLDCMCAVGDVIDGNIVGPDVFCDSECKGRELAGSP